MCGRFTLSTPADEIARLFGAEPLDDEALPARYNVAPTEPILVVRARPAGGARELALLRWGLIPAWTSDPRDFPTLINARAESLDRKPAFQNAVRERRCIVPSDGFFEWREEDGRQPYLVRAADGRPLAMAGLWERWLGPDGRPVDSCTIVTTEATDVLRPIHDRMPALLTPEGVERWLDLEVRSFRDIEPLLRPLPSDRLTIHRVSRRVNRTDVDDPRNVEPLPEGTADPEEAGGRDGSRGARGNASPGDPPPQLELL